MVAYNNNKEFNKLKIVYWNVRSFMQRQNELEHLLKNSPIDILICVESWLTDNYSISCQGYITIRKDRTHSRGGGIIMLIRKSIAFREIVNLKTPSETVELLGIHINNVTPALDIIACYRAPGLTLTQQC